MVYYNKYFIERTQIMSENARLARKRAIWISVLLYAYIYLLFHIPNYVFDPDDWIGSLSWEFYIVIRQDISEKFVYYLIPILMATMVYVTETRLTGAIRSCLALSLPVLLYSLPFCYLFAISQGYDTPESIGISLGLSTAGLLIQALHVFVLYLLAKYLSAYFVYKKLKAVKVRRAKKPIEADSLWSCALKQSREGIVPDSALSLSTPGGVGIFTMVFSEFIVRLVIEIVNTVNLMVNEKGNITVPELLSIIFSYVILLLIMLLVFLIVGKMRNFALAESSNECAEEAESGPDDQQSNQ